MLELRGLTRRYGAAVVVDGLDLTVGRGELVVLVGRSGCGKTTTLKMINRLVEPSAGGVTLGGVDAASLAPHVLRRRIGYVFQEIGLFPHLTVAENIAVTPSLLGWEPARVAQRTAELLDLVELDGDVAGRWPDALSGGQQQRVGVARALAAEPEVLLLDEPFGALDPLTRDRLQQSFQEIRGRLGFSAVFVTHDMLEALLIGDRIAVLEQGRVVQVGTPAELVAAPASEYVAELLTTPRRQASRIDELLGGGA